MNPMLNRPYDQPESHSFLQKGFYNIKHHEDSPSGQVTFHDPQGMPIPWHLWEDAVFILLENHNLQELPTQKISDFIAVLDQDVVQPDPTASEDLEYGILTATKFRFHLHQDQRNAMPQLLGQATVFETDGHAPEFQIKEPRKELAKVQVKIEFPDTPHMRDTLQEMLASPECAKSEVSPKITSRGNTSKAGQEPHTATAHGSHTDGPPPSGDDKKPRRLHLLNEKITPAPENSG